MTADPGRSVHSSDPGRESTGWSGIERRGQGPLAGVRVVDLTRALAGPYATMMLADAGADVVKIEPPGRGDDARGWGPPFIGPPEDRQATYFLAANRNKRSVVLDLAEQPGRVALRNLIAGADVLVENFRPGTMARLGFPAADLQRDHPRLVVLSITGFGEGGPDGERAGYDQIVQGEAGLMSLTGPAGGPPYKVGVPIADILAGMFGAFGVVAALGERERTGRGQLVQTSLLAATLAVLTFQASRWLLAGDLPGCSDNRHPSISPYGTYACADGRINIAVGSERLWESFAPLVGLAPDDRRFASNELRVQNHGALDEQLEAAFLTGSVGSWLDRLNEAGVPAGPVRSVAEAFATEQVAQLGLLEQVVHPVLGSLMLPAAPVRFSDWAAGPAAPPPLLGEHTEAILRALRDPEPS